MKPHTVEMQEWVDELTHAADAIEPVQALAILLVGCLIFWAVVGFCLWTAFQ